MVDPATAGAKVHDLTPAARQISIQMDGASTYELLVAIWATFSNQEEHKSHDLDNHDLGSDWFAKVRGETPEDLRDEIETVGGHHCFVWLGIAGLVTTAPHPRDPDHVLDWLETLHAERLHRWLLSYIAPGAEAGLIEQGASGDLAAVRTIVESSDKHADASNGVLSIFEMPAVQLRDRLVAALRRFRAEVFAPYEAEFGAAIAQAAAQWAQATTDDPQDVIEEVTNGLRYEIPVGVARVVLVPSVVLKPWSLIDRHRDTLLVVFAVADEFIDTDPEAPPSWLVKTYKALGDGRRLRILRRLSEGGATLDELSEMLGLAKSTVHHHIGVLRGAGLVRVDLSGKKETSTYHLRGRSLDEISAILETYLGSEASELQKA